MSKPKKPKFGRKLIPTSEQKTGLQIWADLRERTEAGRFVAAGHDRAPIMMHVLAGVMEGRSVKAICTEDELPVSNKAIFYWMAQDEELRHAYEVARGIAAQMLDDDIADLPRAIGAGEISASSALAVFKISAWRLSVQDPDKYALFSKDDRTHLRRRDTAARLQRAEMRVVK